MHALHHLIDTVVPFKSKQPRYDIDELIEERDSFETIAAEIGENQEALQREIEKNNHLKHRIFQLEHRNDYLQNQLSSKDQQNYAKLNVLTDQLNQQAFLIQRLSQANQAFLAENTFLRNECVRLNAYFKRSRVAFY